MSLPAHRAGQNASVARALQKMSQVHRVSAVRAAHADIAGAFVFQDCWRMMLENIWSASLLIFVLNRWERERDHRPMSRPGGSTSGVPSLLDMSMNMGPNFNPIARVQEIAAKIAQMACNIPRGGGGGGGGMRGGRGGSSGPGGFGQGGRGGGGGGRGFGGDFQHRDSGFHGGKGGSMGGGRGGSSGGGSGSYGNRSSFNNNKRSRSPPKVSMIFQSKSNLN